MKKLLLFILLSTTLVIGQSQSQLTPKEPGAKGYESFYITSEPENASVYIDDIFYGKTPLKLTGFNKHIFSLKLIDENNNTWFLHSASFSKSTGSIHALIGKDYGMLKLSSSPEGADIFLNDTLVGKTPGGPFKIPAGYTTIKVKKQGYKTKEGAVSFSKDFAQLFEYHTQLVSIYSLLDASAIPQTSKIYIDNALIKPERMAPIKVTAGRHTFEIEKDSFSSGFSQNFTVSSDTLYKLAVLKDQFTTKQMLLSLVLPGAGQVSDGSVIKGVGIFTGVVGLGTAALVLLNNYSKKLDNYKSLSDQYMAANDEINTISAKIRLDLAEQEKDKALNNVKIFSGLFACAYLYNIIDALVFHSHKDVLEVNKQESGFELTGSLLPGTNNYSMNARFNF